MTPGPPFEGSGPRDFRGCPGISAVVLWAEGPPSRSSAPLTWASVPDDYDVQIRALRRARGLSQAQLATLVGSAHKAVVYQWEARKRTPSPLFWQRLAVLHRELGAGN